MKVGEVWREKYFDDYYIKIIKLYLEEEYEVSFNEYEPKDLVRYKYIKAEQKPDRPSLLGYEFELPREEFLDRYEKVYNYAGW